MSLTIGLPSLSLPGITILPVPSATSSTPTLPSTSDEPTSVPPTSDPSDTPTSVPPTSSGGGSSGVSSGGSSGGSSAQPSSSSAAETSEAQSSVETTLSESSTSVFESISVITSNGQQITTTIEVTTVAAPGTVITAAAPANNNDGPNVGAIVGGVVGGIAALLAIGALIFFLLRRRRNNFDKEFDGNFDPDYVSKHGTGPTAFATGAIGGSGHRKSGSLEKAGRQRVNLNGANRASLEAALAEDDGMGGRLDASTVGGGVLSPFPYPQGGVGQGQVGYGQAPCNPAMSPPPMSVNLPGSPLSGQAALAGAAGAGAAGYYAGHHNQGGYGQQQQPYGQGYPDRHGAISPTTTDGGGTHAYPNSANPYLSGAATSSSGHGHAINPYGGYVDPAQQSMYGGTAPSVTGTSVSGYGGMGAFGGAAAALSSRTSVHSGGTGSAGAPVGGAMSHSTGMSAKEREARGMRPAGGLGVVNPDDQQPEPRREGSGGSVLPSPFDAANNGGGASGSGAVGGGKAAEANANRQNTGGGLIVHQDGGRVPDTDDTSPGEIPPAYDAILYEQRK
ncbi:hypothetical protein BKA70DRAFT_1386260 [Coprinopsis sp. MPI-PUGE-AT-0042]|nr:hypothetical protein BKA70DRAFT_1386260 [Coprinopsis sp. MPI-PUGE-AT-0042]